jgi:hypothetical protein
MKDYVEGKLPIYNPGAMVWALSTQLAQMFGTLSPSSTNNLLIDDEKDILDTDDAAQFYYRIEDKYSISFISRCFFVNNRT